MTNPTANPLGAGGDVTKAAVKIGAILRGEPPIKEGQPPAESAPVQANSEQQNSKPRNERGMFAKQGEPETVEEGPKAEPEAAKPEAKAAEPSSDGAEHEELADDIDGLATQLGMEPSELLDHLKAKVKINGEEKRVNLRELIAGHQMEADYRQKTAAIAEQRKAAEAERTAYQQQREHISSQLEPLVQQLEGLVVDDEQRLKQLLNDGDLLEFQRLKMTSDQRRAQLEFAKQEKQRIEGEKQRESRQQMEQAVLENERILLEKKPAWAKDVEKGKTELANIRAYLIQEGVPEQNAKTLYEAVPLLLAEKAMLWDKLQKEKPSKLQEVKSIPKFQKPGAARPAEDPKKQVLAASLNRLRKTGNVRDAANAFKAMGLVKPV